MFVLSAQNVHIYVFRKGHYNIVHAVCAFTVRINLLLILPHIIDSSNHPVEIILWNDLMEIRTQKLYLVVK